jgi:hypothetical protein
MRKVNVLEFVSFAPSFVYDALNRMNQNRVQRGTSHE